MKKAVGLKFLNTKILMQLIENNPEMITHLYPFGNQNVFISSHLIVQHINNERQKNSKEIELPYETECIELVLGSTERQVANKFYFDDFGVYTKVLRSPNIVEPFVEMIKSNTKEFQDNMLVKFGKEYLDYLSEYNKMVVNNQSPQTEYQKKCINNDADERRQFIKELNVKLIENSAKSEVQNLMSRTL